MTTRRFIQAASFDPRYDRSKNVNGDRIRPKFIRCGQERKGRQSTEVLLEIEVCVRKASVEHPLGWRGFGICTITETCRVSEQVPDGDIGDLSVWLPRPEIGKIVSGEVAKRQPAVIDKSQSRRCHERFCHGSEAEYRPHKPVVLTAREWVLFEAFIQRPGQLLSKAQLEERLYSFDQEVESNAIEVHVSRLRKKLGARVIETERGLGYRLGRP